MKPTALQQAFKDIEQMCPELFDIYTEKGKDFIRHFHKYLEMEKQQIIEAHGLIAVYNPETLRHDIRNGETYYEQTYKQD